jgi:hypothetical protein
MPISRKTWFVQSASEWIASAIMAFEPVNAEATNFAIAMAPLAASA